MVLGPGVLLPRTGPPQWSGRLARSRLPFLSRLALVLGVALQAPVAQDAWLQLTLHGLGAGLIVAGIAREAGAVVRGALLAASLLLYAPALLGEQSGTLPTVLALAVAALTAVHAVTVRAASWRGAARRGAVPLLLVAGYWLLVVREPAAPVEARALAQYFGLAILIVCGVLRDPRVVRTGMVIVSGAVATLGWLSLIAVALGPVLAGQPIDRHGNTWRSDFAYTWNVPFTITNSPGVAGTERVSDLGGEPGTWAMFCVLALVIPFVCGLRGRVRVYLLSGAGVGLLLSQSSGAFGAVLIAVAAVLLVEVLRPRSRFRSTSWLLLLGIAALAVPAVTLLVTTKASSNSRSLTDRGFSLSTTPTSGGLSTRINLLGTLSVDGAATLLLVAAFVALLVVGGRRPVSLFLVTFGFAMALFIQPEQYHVGFWIALCLVVTIEWAHSSAAVHLRTEAGQATS